MEPAQALHLRTPSAFRFLDLEAHDLGDVSLDDSVVSTPQPSRIIVAHK